VVICGVFNILSTCFLGIFYGEREGIKVANLTEQLSSWVWHKDMQVIDTLAIKDDSNLQATHPH